MGTLNDGSPRFKCLGLEHRYTGSVISRGLSIILISLVDECLPRKLHGARSGYQGAIVLPSVHPIQSSHLFAPGDYDGA